MMRVSEPETPNPASGFTRKSSPGSYAVVDVEPEAITEAEQAEQRIEALKAYHAARVRLDVLASELCSAPASDIVPGVTAAYVDAMRQCLQVLLLNADVAEGL